MPNYDLRCVKCNQDYNIRASMAEKAEKRIPCPDCGSFELETIFKAPPAYVKNSGAAQCPQRSSCGGCRHAG
jgi:putative FmdB family regulatory protein